MTHENRCVAVVVTEAKPAEDALVFCASGQPCRVLIEGFGLRMHDALKLVPLAEGSSSDKLDCPPVGSSGARLKAYRPLEQFGSTSRTVFDFGEFLEPGLYSMCYAVRLASGKNDADTRDYHNLAGTLRRQRRDMVA
jgi:hypothetical protein